VIVVEHDMRVVAEADWVRTSAPEQETLADRWWPRGHRRRSQSTQREPNSTVLKSCAGRGSILSRGWNAVCGYSLRAVSSPLVSGRVRDNVLVYLGAGAQSSNDRGPDAQSITLRCAPRHLGSRIIAKLG
jgi:hypothetical protein